MVLSSITRPIVRSPERWFSIEQPLSANAALIPPTNNIFLRFNIGISFHGHARITKTLIPWGLLPEPRWKKYGETVRKGLRELRPATAAGLTSNTAARCRRRRHISVSP